ncbi:MAG: PorP/SprF family type IX secretion system membrane protein, partial [Muribaculaceae bacterium]|nr:PorP/SprF family type IX secretion system membrane protein [Muribaculaceae bacterium]
MHIFFRLLPLLLAMLCATAARAQSDAQFSQYYEVPNYYNPAATGTTDLLKIRAGMRMQWVGIHNAPRTFAGVADMPFKFLGKRFGVGLVMQQESYGLYSNMNLGAQLSYKQKIFKGLLSAGVQIGFVDQSFKGSEVYIPEDDDYHQGSDDAIPQQDIKGNAFDVGLGLMFTHKWFWAALSATHLNSPTM